MVELLLPLALVLARGLLAFLEQFYVEIIILLSPGLSSVFARLAVNTLHCNSLAARILL